MSRNLAQSLTDTAARRSDHIAIKLDDFEVNYGLLDQASARAAGWMRELGVGTGDRVGIMLPNVPHFPVTYYGALRLGGVVVPMNPLLKGREVEHYLTDSGAKVLFAWSDFEEAAKAGAEAAGAELILVEAQQFIQDLFQKDPVEEVADRDGEDTAVLIYTSGTTGTPKGAELSHENLLSNVETCLDSLIEIGDDDVVLGALPFFHSFGQTCALNACIKAGGTLTLIPRFDPDNALEIIERDKVTIFEGVPTMYVAMLGSEKQADTSSLRLCVSGGSAMPGEVLRAFEEKFDAQILEGYGLSETSPVASFNHPDKERKVGSIGTPIKGVEMKVVDDDGNDVPQGEVGEIVIKGPNVMKGYWGKPDATAETIRDGWFHTGDMAKVDDDGYFFIVDRKKELILRGGYNVYPREVEEVLYEHPAVAEVAVVGFPDDKMGEEVGAAVVLKSGESIEEDELRSYAKEQLANYKYPRKIWFPDELPKGATGKILKREIKPPA